MEQSYADKEKRLMRALDEHRLIAILRGVGNDTLLAHVAALYEGGLRFVEIALPPEENKKAMEDTITGIETLVREWSGCMHIGAGTVCSADQAEQAVSAGATYLISPHFDKSLVHRAISLGAVPMPGVMTPSEMMQAKTAGAPCLKIFPASVMGSAYFKAVLSPLPRLKLMAVGGVDAGNLASFLQNGAYGAGIGGALCDKRAIAAGDWGSIRDYARRLTAIIEAEVGSCG